MENYKKLFITTLLAGWIHLAAFFLSIIVIFSGIIYTIYMIIENNGKLQEFFLIFVAGFFSLTILGSFCYASHELIRGLKTLDYHRMVMFRICVSLIIILSGGYGSYLILNLYNETMDIDDILYSLIFSSAILIVEIATWILVAVASNRIHNEVRRNLLRDHYKRKANSVVDQLTILKPAFCSEQNDEGQNDKSIEQTTEFIENEKAIFERTFEKVQVRQKKDDFPPPPKGF